MSLEVAKVIASVQAKPGGELYTAPVIATSLAFITGFIVLAIGLLRLGWLVEFIPAPAVSGFMTGSAISIIAGQFPGLMGYSSKFKCVLGLLEALRGANALDSLQHSRTRLPSHYQLVQVPRQHEA